VGQLLLPRPRYACHLGEGELTLGTIRHRVILRQRGQVQLGLDRTDESLLDGGEEDGDGDEAVATGAPHVLDDKIFDLRIKPLVTHGAGRRAEATNHAVEDSNLFPSEREGGSVKVMRRRGNEHTLKMELTCLMSLK
jgi:hypothetical protein